MDRKKRASKRDVDILMDEISPWWKKTTFLIRKKEIATWKGVLFLTFIAGAFSALIWLVRSDSLESSIAAPASTLYFTPSTNTVSNGSNFSLDAMINPGTNKVTAVALKVSYDPTKLSLESITPSPIFSLVLANANINNTTGVASIDLAIPTTNPSIVSVSSIASYNFRAMAPVSNSLVSFTAGSQAAAENEAGDVIATRVGATITIDPATIADTTPPTGGSISYVNGNITATSASLTVSDGSDLSGINVTSRKVLRRSAVLSGKRCGSYGMYSVITTTGIYPNLIDSAVANGNCYQYQYQVSDNAIPANQATYTSLNVLKVGASKNVGGGRIKN